MFSATWFQPDEFYQALEPAWALAFGKESGAWITWVCSHHHYLRLPGHTINMDIGQEWTHQLRSSIQPILLSAVYMLISKLSSTIDLPPTLRIQLSILLPKILFALSAAVMDYSTWRLAGRVYGKGSVESGAAVRSVHSGNIIQVLQSSRLIHD